MALLAEILRLDRALWGVVYERQMDMIARRSFDHAQLEATLIADEALALADEGTDESLVTAAHWLRSATELLETLPPCQPPGALQDAIAGRLRCPSDESQSGTGAERSAAPSTQWPVRRLG